MGLQKQARRAGRALSSRLSRLVLRVIPPFDDAPRRWKGETDPSLEPFRLLRYGECSWREYGAIHDRGLGVGYPLVVARRLAERGLGMRFEDVYVRGFSQLPATREELVRYVRSEEPPHMVLVQVEYSHATRVVLPTGKAWIRLREFGLRLVRPFGRVHYALVHLALRRFGRIAFLMPADARERMDRFYDLVEAEWPGVPVLSLAPSARPLHDGWLDPEAGERAVRVGAATAEARGIPRLDCRDAIAELGERMGRRTVHNGTGYDLKWPGQELVGDAIADWIEREGVGPVARLDAAAVPRA